MRDFQEANNFVPKPEVQIHHPEHLTAASDWSAIINQKEHQVSSEFESWRQRKPQTSTFTSGIHRIAIQRSLSHLTKPMTFERIWEIEEMKMENQREGKPRLKASREVVTSRNALAMYAQGRLTPLIDKVTLLYDEGRSGGETFPLHTQAHVNVGRFASKTEADIVHEVCHLVPEGGFISNAMNEGMADWMMNQVLKRDGGAYPAGKELMQWLVQTGTQETGISQFSGILQQAFLSGKLEFVDTFLTKPVRELIEVNSILDLYALKTDHLTIDEHGIESSFIKFLVNNRKNSELIDQLRASTLNGNLKKSLQYLLAGTDQRRGNPPQFIFHETKAISPGLDKVMSAALPRLLAA